MEDSAQITKEIFNIIEIGPIENINENLFLASNNKIPMKNPSFSICKPFYVANELLNKNDSLFFTCPHLMHTIFISCRNCKSFFFLNLFV